MHTHIYSPFQGLLCGWQHVCSKVRQNMGVSLQRDYLSPHVCFRALIGCNKSYVGVIYTLTGQNVNVCVCECAVCMSLGAPYWLWWTLTCWKASWWRSASPTSPTDGWELLRLNIELNKRLTVAFKEHLCESVFESSTSSRNCLFKTGKCWMGRRKIQT